MMREFKRTFMVLIMIINKHSGVFVIRTILFLFCISLISKHQTAAAQQKIFHLKVSNSSQLARQDLAALFFESNRNVKSVTKNIDGSIQVEFLKEFGVMFDAAKKVTQTDDAFMVIRDEWQKNYMNHPEEIKLPFKMPKTLKDFTKLTKYQKWPVEIIESELKDRKRTVYRHKNFQGHVIRISEMKLTQNETKNHPAKEVEIAISFGKDYVFFVFDEEGNLTSAAQFPERKLKAPLSCNGCHYDLKTRSIGRFFKSVP